MGKFNISKLKERALSAVFMAPVIIFIIVAGGVFFQLLIALSVLICLYEWFNLSLKVKHKALFLVLGSVYILLTLYSCYLLRENFGYAVTLLFIVLVWTSDIGAYFFGKFIGGAKMVPSISPNKTWAGMIGAALSPAIIIVLWIFIAHNFSPYGLVEELPSYVILAISGAFIGVFGQAGDLLISFAKRQANIKDTGDLIPGHGGLLDRIDAMLMAAPFFLIAIMSLLYA